MIVKDTLGEYLKLMEERPELFLPSDVIEIVKDRAALAEYSESYGVTLGVLYRSKYNILVVDLVESRGTRFPYERIIPAADGRGVVCIPVYCGKLVLLRQYRHATRSEQICFPRGFGEVGLPSYENAKKELSEELGASSRELLKIGELTPDSGLSSCICDVYLCSLESLESTYEEGITEYLLISPEDLKIMIECGDIVDAFTLSALQILDSVGIDIHSFDSPRG